KRICVVAIEDRRRVAADCHERAVTERNLSRVAREDVQAEDRDEEGRDVAADELVVVREPRRQQGDDARRRGDHRESLHRQPHTRLTTRRPNRPDGRTTITPSSSASATGSRSSDVTKWTYVPSRFNSTPSARPPTTAPNG